ncbi:MAG: LLM class flavin-dependent oxidoreductase [Candidatus Limnocylindrales bacterium]|jgi:alkanesulfonate monooxygenase SsuD/methylene tetrahydromethanopterin reductase-like flavin-dependent oxidoreductase (luciferase family)
MDTTATRRRPLRVGVQLPEIEHPVRWPELAQMIRRIEALGFDSIWTGDHFLYRMKDGTVDAPWDAWSVLAAAAAITSRVTLGPLVTPVGFYNPAVLAKKAATVDEISGGRLILGLGAGWNEVEFRGYGVPFDHRTSRFEEAFTIIRTLLAEGRIDFEGEYYSARDCQLVPQSRLGGPPLMIGSVGERMLKIALPYVRSWNVWHTDTHNSPAGVASLLTRVAAACDAVGRDPATVEATVVVLVRMPGGKGRRQGDGELDRTPNPLQGPPELIAEELRAYARAGVAEVQLVVDPITIESLEGLAPALELLDRG